jgi:hypothetical protein
MPRRSLAELTGPPERFVSCRALARIALPALCLVTAYGCGNDDNDDNEPADASSCHAGTYQTPAGCLTCEQARAEVTKGVQAVLEGADTCSTDDQCVSSGNIAIGCLNACASPIAASHKGDLSKAVVDAKYGGFCVCYQQPPECFPTAKLGCVAGKCRFL